jgi:hypothetical protein
MFVDVVDVVDVEDVEDVGVDVDVDGSLIAAHTQMKRNKKAKMLTVAPNMAES